MKLFTTIAIIAVGIATASPAAPLDPREDAAAAAIASSELKGLPYGMKSKPDCPKFKYYCLHCEESDFNCVTDPVCEWCREHDDSWNDGSTGGGRHV